MRLAVVVMAAGMGTRMKSDLPKVLHPILGKPMLSYTLNSVAALAPVEVVVITGYEAEMVKANVSLPDEIPLSFALQSPQLGTGHAVQQAEALLKNQADVILVVPGDLPLLSADTFQTLVQSYKASQDDGSPDTKLVMLTVEAEDPRGFGRVVRNEAGHVAAIVEVANCTPEQRAIRELNVGAYLFEASWLWDNLTSVSKSDVGEYYLTDLIAIAVSQGHNVGAEVIDDRLEAIGVNTRVHLAEVAEVLRRRLNHRWMEAGVSIIDPASTYIEADVTLAQDTVIYPNTYLHGHTQIGKNCTIGPNSFINNSQVADGCEIRFSVVEDSTLEQYVDVGPFSHLRGGAHLATGVHIGNFGEVKNSYLGAGTKMGHFSYLGDAKTGANVNVGAGTITCNYDGANKNPTTIGDNAFIGSDTMLVAPLNIGANAKTGAGAVVIHDVPEGKVAYGVPARIKKSE